jgi:hypothetical protein
MGNNTSTSELSKQGAIFGRNSPAQSLTVSQMQRIQKQIVFEYPFLSNVYESILVTDNRLPDCPIGA